MGGEPTLINQTQLNPSKRNLAYDYVKLRKTPLHTVTPRETPSHTIKPRKSLYNPVQPRKSNVGVLTDRQPISHNTRPECR